MNTFEEIYAHAVEKKGEKQLKKILPKPKSAKALLKISDDRWLSQFTKSVFQAGFVWRVVEQKWPAFEKAFHKFSIEKNAFMTPDQIFNLAEDVSIIRNLQKIESVPKNAWYIFEVLKQHGSFSKYISRWPSEEYYLLLEDLKLRGSRLGGTSSQYALRQMGKDGFILTQDVNNALIENGVIKKPSSSKTAMKTIQEAFNVWMQESKLPLSAISKVLACSVGD